MKKLLAFVMALAIVGMAIPTLAVAKEVKVKRDRVVAVVSQAQYPRNAKERFLVDYNYCMHGFACGGAD